MLEFSTRTIEALFGFSNVIIGEPIRRRSTLFKLSTLHGDYMLRIYPKEGKRNEEIQAHIALSSRLTSGTHVIESPIPALDGTTSVLLVYEREIRVAMVTPFYCGETVKLKQQSASAFGILLGSFHSANANMKTRFDFDPVLDVEADVGSGLALVHKLHVADDNWLVEIDVLVTHLLSSCRQSFATGTFLQICHGDAWIGNMLYSENGQTLIDLEDVCFGDPLYDIATFLWSIVVGKEPFPAQIFGAFREGYELEHRLVLWPMSVLKGLFVVREFRILRFLAELGGFPEQMLIQHVREMMLRFRNIKLGMLEKAFSEYTDR